MCPSVPGKFTYADIVLDALELQGVCKKALKGSPLGLLYYEGLSSQKSTLTGFVTLVIPLLRHLRRGLEAPSLAVEELKRSEPWEARAFLRALSALGLSHYKKVEGFVDADKWDAYQGNLWDLFVYLGERDHLFREIVLGYPLSKEGARYILKKGYSEESVKELQRALLSSIIDSLVARRHGYKVALELVKAAREGFHEWYIREKKLNPGTVADIIAVSILLALAEEGT